MCRIATLERQNNKNITFFCCFLFLFQLLFIMLHHWDLTFCYIFFVFHLFALYLQPTYAYFWASLSLCAPCRRVSVLAVCHRLWQWLHLHPQPIQPISEAGNQSSAVIHADIQQLQHSLPATLLKTLVWSDAQRVDQHLLHFGQHEGCSSDVQRLIHEQQEAAE